MTSIRSRLLLWIGLPFTLVGLLTLATSYYVLSHQITETFDDMLLNAAERMERRIYSVDGELRINMHYFSISTLGSRGDGKIFYRIRDAEGNIIGLTLFTERGIRIGFDRIGTVDANAK